jgi:hypothetical protein
MKNIYDYSFRELDKKFLLIDIPEGFEEIDGFESKDANKILCYGFIDTESGISFEVLSFVKFNAEDKSIKIIGGNNSNRFFFRIGFIENCNAEIVDDVLSDADIKSFKEKIFIIDTGYAVNDDIEKMRAITGLDEFRHKEYPDMIEVTVSKKERKSKKVNVICCAIKDNGLYGRVIGNSLADWGINADDEINFGVVKLDGQLACISIVK